MRPVSAWMPGMVLAAALSVAACSSNGGTTALTAPAAGGSTASTADATVHHQIAQVRAATAAYHNLDKAVADGFAPLTGCVSSPAGAMGFHYGNETRINDPAIDYLEPEILVYAPGNNGKLKLVAVEYIVPAPIWPGGFENPPSLFGLPFHPGPPPLIVLHAWIWQHNPSGMFEDWNPTVSCD